MKLNWTAFKAEVVSRSLYVQYVQSDAYYALSAYDGYVCTNMFCELSRNPTDTTDLTDFETNYKPTANKPLSSRDEDGAPLQRFKAATKGWTYNLLTVEFDTSTLTAPYSKKHDNTNRTGITKKIYDVNDAEIITPGEADANLATCVKTVLDIEPPYDYEIVSGFCRQTATPNTNIRLWVVAVPDVPENSGGSKEMIGGVNLKFIDPADKVESDGRASKYMTYNATYHTNKLRIILRHDAGINHDLLVAFEMFKV